MVVSASDEPEYTFLVGKIPCIQRYLDPSLPKDMPHAMAGKIST